MTETPCHAEDWDEIDQVWDECELPEGHRGMHFAKRADGTVVAGDAPADWHRLCMLTYEIKQRLAVAS